MQFVYYGAPPKWVGGKDIILRTIQEIGVDGARYAAMEFTGEAVPHLDMADRFAMANMAIESGAKAGLGTADERTREFVDARSDRPGLYFESDPDADYAAVYEFDAPSSSPGAVPLCRECETRVRDYGPRSTRWDWHVHQ
jgi:3-isopropylmalate/(R)-2-methylmalate dehydratase large subunit